MTGTSIRQLLPKRNAPAWKRNTPAWGLFGLLACGCSSEPTETPSRGAAGSEQGSDAAEVRDIDRAFPEAVRTMSVKITKEDWQTVLDTMESYCGAFGASRMGCSGGGNMLDAVPNAALAWVPSTVETDNQVWKNVAFRLKGNSSLTSAWEAGSTVLPFRLGMDRFEDEDPSITDQRFYGFDKLSFFNNMGDSSGIRERVAEDLFREADVPAVRSGFTYVNLIVGDEAIASALYSMAEVPDKQLMRRHFSSDDGNLYKPISTLESFVLDEFQEDDIEDYSDVKRFIATLNSESRTTSPASWRAELESQFDVQGFLRYLAVNTVIANWDAYGQMAHNYYLYNDAGRLKWIAWDLGLALQSNSASTSIWHDDTDSGSMGMMQGGTGPGGPGDAGPGMGFGPFLMQDGSAGSRGPEGMGPFAPTGDGGALVPMGDGGGAFPAQGPGASVDGGGPSGMGAGQWPLITNLLEDPVFCSDYADIMQRLLDSGPLTKANFDNKVAGYGARVAPYGTEALSFDMEARITQVRRSLEERTYVCSGRGADGGSPSDGGNGGRGASTD